MDGWMDGWVDGWMDGIITTEYNRTRTGLVGGGKDCVQQEMDGGEPVGCGLARSQQERGGGEPVGCGLFTTRMGCWVAYWNGRIEWGLFTTRNGETEKRRNGWNVSGCIGPFATRISMTCRGHVWSGMFVTRKGRVLLGTVRLPQERVGTYWA